MKKIIPSVFMIAVCSALIPAVPACLSGNTVAVHGNDSDGIVMKEYIFDEADIPGISDKPYKVLDISSGQVLEVPVRDYVIGAVCAEMPASFEEEALKAQAVTAHTYAERQRITEQENPSPELCGADFSNDTSIYQGYFTDSQIKHYFGDNYDEYYKKISSAVDEVLPYILTYNEQPAIAAFHSMSSGRTESAENVWGTPVEYLVPVDSSYDTSAPRYMEEVSIDKAFLKNCLETSFEGINLGDDMTEWVIPAEISASGTVLTVRAGDMTVTGNDIRNALGLRSADFEVEYTDSQAVFSTKGFGHGVGMSQYGANAMASEGSSWQEILNHYYTGCEIRNINSTD
ncbi:MAG: stage II sporulation protein D [Ruminococcus flavefaciens]|nr:stage II sporulation protein D [Ruminococcus flavefaciens]MCM1228752.1 stage II sporulation protein D [Ruminococcus flavefaciens]